MKVTILLALASLLMVSACWSAEHYDLPKAHILAFKLHQQRDGNGWRLHQDYAGKQLQGRGRIKNITHKGSIDITSLAIKGGRRTYVICEGAKSEYLSNLDRGDPIIFDGNFDELAYYPKPTVHLNNCTITKVK